MITLYAVRHGETDYNRESRVQGLADSSLTDFGRKQAAALAGRFKDVDITSLYTSPLSRARDTANAIAEAAGIEEITPIDEFKELDCGVFQDQLLSEIKETSWDEWLLFLSNPAIAPENGESMNQLAMRVSSALSMVNFGLSNASIASFINKYDRWTCLKWNDTEHLGSLEGEVKFVL